MTSALRSSSFLQLSSRRVIVLLFLIFLSRCLFQVGSSFLFTFVLAYAVLFWCGLHTSMNCRNLAVDLTYLSHLENMLKSGMEYSFPSIFRVLCFLVSSFFSILSAGQVRGLFEEVRAVERAMLCVEAWWYISRHAVSNVHLNGNQFPFWTEVLLLRVRYASFKMVTSSA